MSSEVSSSFCPQSHLWLKCQPMNTILMQTQGDALAECPSCSCPFPHLNSPDGEPPSDLRANPQQFQEQLTEHFRNGLTPNEPVKFLDTRESPHLFLGGPRLPTTPNNRFHFQCQTVSSGPRCFPTSSPTTVRSARCKIQPLRRHYSSMVLLS